mgnify:CR=1 FL=1
MSNGTRMVYGCPNCKGRFSEELPIGVQAEHARFKVDVDLHDPELAGQCLEIHLHGRSGKDVLIQTVRLMVDPYSYESSNGEPAGVRITAHYQQPPEWPVVQTIKGSRLLGGQFSFARLVIGAIPEFCYDVPPDEETAGGAGVLIVTVPITAMWIYAPSARYG